MSKATAILNDEEILRRRDKDSFDSGFEAGIGWALSADNQTRLAVFPELLGALDALRSFMWKQGYADQTPETARADAAIASAEAIDA